MKKTIFMLIAFTLSVNAQEVKMLSLKDAINYALQNKSEAIKANLAVENSEYQIQEVRSQALPQISANGNLTYNPIIQQTVIDGASFGQPGTTIQAEFGQKWTSVAGVSLTQNIFNQQVFTGLKAAKTTREFYKINKDLTDEQVIERVANAYYQVYLQRQKLTVIENNLKNTTKVKEIIKNLFDNGLAKKIDLDRITVTLNNITTTRQQLLNAVEVQENALKFYMGMPMDEKITIPDSEVEVTPLQLEESANTALRSEYKLLESQKSLLELNKQAMKSLYYPTLSLTAGYNYIGQGPQMPWGARPSDKVYWSDFSSVGLNLNIPIFTGFGTRAKVRQADIDVREAEADLADTKLSLDLAYKNAKTQIENSLITIENQRQNVTLAQEVLDNTQNNYVNGLATLTDLLDAENSLVESQNNYNNALLEYKLAEIQLIKSKGELKTLIN
ncbi:MULTISPECIES: TolC family protein [Flavobacterium]|uniref:TolC family protein n=1 Tax=Flavobacterium TaxID=237 RepID=UPI0023F3EFD2|nr:MULTISPECIES: TolC family protein [Flavobacterium]MDP2161684.1 TolC family protein [Flavobacterium sp.]